MKENLGGVRHIIDRIGLPQRIGLLIHAMEAEGLKLEDPPEVGAKEVRQLMGLVDGHWLLGALVAHIVSALDPAEFPELAEPAPEPEPEIEPQDANASESKPAPKRKPKPKKSAPAAQ